MLSLVTSSVAFSSPAVMAPRAAPVRAVSPRMETVADLEKMAEKLNPVVKFWDPLGLATPSEGEGSSWFGQYGDAGAIAWLRHAEIKHGRVAMAAFVGFIVQSTGIHFPWPSVSGVDLYSIAAPAAQWDAVPTAAKLQILGFIGLLELWGEGQMSPHYLKGGKPGEYPSFAKAKETIGHPLFDLFDPFGFSKNKTPEQKERGLLVEINNGRAAMIGIFGFISAASVEGSVPVLAGKIAHYDGETMAPFSAADASLPYVSEMLNFPHLDAWSKLFWWSQ